MIKVCAYVQSYHVTSHDNVEHLGVASVVQGSVSLAIEYYTVHAYIPSL